jgi:hypothetical protein
MEIHTDVPGRTIATADKPKDSIVIGTKLLKATKLKEWTQKAKAFYGMNSDETMFEDKDITPPDSHSPTPSGSPIFPTSNPVTPAGLDQPETTTPPGTSSELEQFDADWNEWEWAWTEAEAGDFGMWSIPEDVPESEAEIEASEEEEEAESME